MRPASRFGAMHWNIHDFVAGRHQPLAADPATSFGLDLPVPLGGRRARQRDRAGMGEEIHARRRGREDRMPDPDPARRERPHRAARRRRRCSTSSVGAKNKTLKIFTAERRRRRALSGRQPSARRRLHRRLAPERPCKLDDETVVAADRREPRSGAFRGRKVMLHASSDRSPIVCARLGATTRPRRRRAPIPTGRSISSSPSCRAAPPTP